MLDVVVIGPVPGSAGGVGVMAGYLQETESHRTRISFVDSGGSPGSKVTRIRAMAAAALRCLRSDENPTVYVLSLSSGGSAWRKVTLGALLRLRGKPYVLHLHGGGFQRFYDRLPGIGQKIIRSLYHHASGVLVLGEFWAQFVITQMEVPPKKVTIVPNAVPGPDVVPQRSGPVRVLFVGRVGSHKGVLELLAAWRGINASDYSRLVLAGDLNDPTGSISKLVDGMDGVDLLGWVGAEQVTEQLAQSHVLVLPSHGENLPLSLLEGMAWGLAPVVTPVGAIPEVIDHGVNGLVVPVRDAQALAEAIQQLVTEPDTRQRIAEAARRSWEQEYSLEQYRPVFDDAVETARNSWAETGRKS